MPIKNKTAQAAVRKIQELVPHLHEFTALQAKLSQAMNAENKAQIENLLKVRIPACDKKIMESMSRTRHSTDKALTALWPKDYPARPVYVRDRNAEEGERSERLSGIDMFYAEEAAACGGTVVRREDGTPTGISVPSKVDPDAPEDQAVADAALSERIEQRARDIGGTVVRKADGTVVGISVPGKKAETLAEVMRELNAEMAARTAAAEDEKAIDDALSLDDDENPVTAGQVGDIIPG